MIESLGLTRRQSFVNMSSKLHHGQAQFRKQPERQSAHACLQNLHHELTQPHQLLSSLPSLIVFVTCKLRSLVRQQHVGHLEGAVEVPWVWTKRKAQWLAQVSTRAQ